MTTNPYATNQAAHNQAPAQTASIDWTSLMTQCMFEGGQAFLKTVSNANTCLDKAQLLHDEKQVDQRLAQALANAQRARNNPDPHVLAAVRNWSRKQAIAILREQVAGKPIRQDFYLPFQYDLHQEIATMVLDLQRFWDQEDEQRVAAEQRRLAAKREEAEQAYGAAHPYIRGLNDAVLQGERERQAIFESGQQAAQGWATKYEESVNRREQEIEARMQHIARQEQENRAHHLALRSLTKWDDRRSFADTVVSTGKSTVGCLFLWLVLIVGILLAVYFTFPAHH